MRTARTVRWAPLGGLTHSLHITSGQVGLLGGRFFIRYFIFQVPAAEFAERRSVERLMF